MFIRLLRNHWRKLPPMARQDDHHLHELSGNRRSQHGTQCCSWNVTRRIQEGPRGGRRRQSICPANLPENFALESILAEKCTHHQEGPWVRPNMGPARWLARDNPETNPITIKPETASHVAEQFSWVPLPRCSPLGHPFPIKFFALSARVPPWTIHFRVLDKSHSWALEGVLLPAKTWVAKIYVIYNGYRVHCQNNLYPILWRK